MNNNEWRKLKQIGSLCGLLAQVISESGDLFIAQRPFLVEGAKARDPWYNPNLENLEARARANKNQLEVTKRLLREKLGEWLGEGGYEAAQKIFGVGRPNEG